MRIVLDTNVLIAAFVAAAGRCAELLEYCVVVHELVTSDILLDEYRHKLQTKFRLAPVAAEGRTSLLRSQMAVVVPRPCRCL